MGHNTHGRGTVLLFNYSLKFLVNPLIELLKFIGVFNLLNITG